jgi:hypothetical protein
MLLIAERLSGARDKPWVDFAAANEDLLIWKPSVLSRFYSDEILSSRQARETFVMPPLGCIEAV